MKKTLSILLVALLAAMFIGCPPAEETNTNTNANTEESAKTVEATIIEVDDSFTAAAEKKDSKFFDENVTNDFVGQTPEGPADKAMVVKYIGDDPCSTKSDTPTDRKVVEFSDDVALLTGKSTAERDCDGKKSKNSERYAVLWVKDGDTWKAAFYQNIPASSEEASSDSADSNSNSNTASNANTAGNTSNSSANTSEKPAGGGEAKSDATPMTPNIPNDEALAKTLIDIDKRLWEAFSKKDTKPFEELLAEKFVIMHEDGASDRAGELKNIAEHDCTINSWSLSNEKATKVGENFAILTYKGTQSGKCGEETLPGTVYTATIFMKDGDSWKVVYHGNSPEQKM